MNQCKVNGLLFSWSVVRQTTEYKELLMPVYGLNAVDVLHIKGEDSKFEIAVRIDAKESSGSLGPMLVLGQNFPNTDNSIQPGMMLRIRPKLTRLEKGKVEDSVVQNLLQWCFSSKFQAVRVNGGGGLWVGYGKDND